MVVQHKGLDIFCQRCNVKVYPVDKIGPLKKGGFFHNQCFRCRICGLSLNMKNFIQNQLDPEDKEVYCNNHVPKSYAGHFSGDAIGIRSALLAPRKALFCNEQIRGSDKYNPDTHAVEIHNALLNLKTTGKEIDHKDLYNPKKWEKIKPYSDKIEDIIQRHSIHDSEQQLSEDLPPHISLMHSYNGVNVNSHSTNNDAGDILKSKAAVNGRVTTDDSNSLDSNISTTSSKNIIKEKQSINGNIHSPLQNFLSQHHKCHINGLSNMTNSPSPSDDTVDYESQIDLEKRLRAEEDEMYATFARKRCDEEKNLDTKFKGEFLRALTDLRQRFSKMTADDIKSIVADFSPPTSSVPIPTLSSKTSSTNQATLTNPNPHYQKRNGNTSITNNSSSSSLSGLQGSIPHAPTSEISHLVAREERDLERRLTVKRDREKDALSRKLMDYERAEMSKLMERHASEMIKFTTLRRTAGKPKKRGALDMYTNNTNQEMSSPVLNNSNNHQSEHSYTNDFQSSSTAKKFGAVQPPTYTRVGNNSSHINGSANFGADKMTNKHGSADPYYTPVNGNSSAYASKKPYHSITSTTTINTEPPAPRPPKCPKSQIYSDPSVFEEIDQRAINIASTNQNSFTDLVRQLTRHCTTDVQRARALFRWITIKNLNRMTFDTEVASDTPMGLLRGIKLGTESYHMLFKRLCSYAGLHCVVIRGYSKSAGYLPGMKFEDTSHKTQFAEDYLGSASDTNTSPSLTSRPNENNKRFRNTWNAAYLDGSWRFVQCNWGARHLVNNSSSSSKQQHDTTPDETDSPSSNENLRYEYDDHYFLTDPNQFIYEFYPKQADWQLLPTALTLQQFEKLPFVRSLFFKYGLSFVDSVNGGALGAKSSNSVDVVSAILFADNTGAANLTLKMPSALVSSLVFHYNLRFYNSHSSTTPSGGSLANQSQRDNQLSTTSHNSNGFGNPDSIDGINMRRYVMQTLVGNCVVFKVHCPCRGDFLLDVFANQVNASDYASGRAMRFKSVCKAKIACKALEKIMIPLPDCASGEWGPVKAYKLFAMIPVTHEDAVINTQSHMIVIKFRFSSSTSSSPPALSNSALPHSYNKKRLVDFAAALHKNDFEPPDSVIFGKKPHGTPNDEDKQTVLSKCVVPKWCFIIKTTNRSHSSAKLQSPDSGTWSDNVDGIKFEISLPEEGQYGLDIYAREEVMNGKSYTSPTTLSNSAKDKQLLTHACKYLINYRLA